jgi:hypothetical protein
MLGHNGGPPLPSPASWNSYCWGKAVRRSRATPSREVLAIRRRRAAELGLDYATYAAILADAGTTPRALIFMLPWEADSDGGAGKSTTSAGALSPGGLVTKKLVTLTVPAILVVIDPSRAEGKGGREAPEAVASSANTLGIRLDASGVAPSGGVAERAHWLVALIEQAGLSLRSALLIGPERQRELASRARLAGLLSPARYFGLSSTLPSD